MESWQRLTIGYCISAGGLIQHHYHQFCRIKMSASNWKLRKRIIRSIIRCNFWAVNGILRFRQTLIAWTKLAIFSTVSRWLRKLWGKVHVVHHRLKIGTITCQKGVNWPSLPRWVIWVLEYSSWCWKESEFLIKVEITLDVVSHKSLLQWFMVSRRQLGAIHFTVYVSERGESTKFPSNQY